MVGAGGGGDDVSAASSPLSPVAGGSSASGVGSSDMGDGLTRLYPWRFVVLTLFVLYSMSNAFQWIQYSIISNLVQVRAAAACSVASQHRVGVCKR